MWEALRNTMDGEGGISLTLNRERAKSSKDSVSGRSAGDLISSECLFMQVYKELKDQRPSRLRKPDHVFRVRFEGEDAADAGGPYR